MKEEIEKEEIDIRKLHDVLVDINPSPHRSKNRLLQINIEYERIVLACLLADNTVIDEISDLIDRDNFGYHIHSEIFVTIKQLISEKKTAEIFSVEERMLCNNLTKKEIYWDVLQEILKSIYSTNHYVNAKHAAEKLREHKTNRELLIIAQGFVNDVMMHKPDCIDTVQQRLSKISDIEPKKAFKASDLLPATIALLEDRRTSGGALRGLSTGLNNLDEMTHGLQAGELTILAARPSMGKSTLCMNIAEHVAVKKNLPVVFFSLEMPSQSLIERTLSSLSQVNTGKIRSGQINEQECQKITETIPLIDASKLFIDERSDVSISDMRSECRRIKREHGLSLVIIDYLQLMKVAGSKENRTNEISEISRSLKAMAKDLNVPVLALSQLNRGLEQRVDKRPIMSDLRDSGSIEQDADLILFIYRDEVYSEHSRHKGYAEINIAKQRNGALGTIYLKFEGEYCRFTEFTEQLPDNKPEKSVKRSTFNYKAMIQ